MPGLLTDDDREQATMSSEEAVSLREHIERLLAEHERRHELDRDATLRALEEARRIIDERLEALNELRREVTEDRGQLVQRTLFDEKVKTMDADRQLLRDELSAIRSELANQRGRQAAYAAVLATALIVVPILVQILLGRG